LSTERIILGIDPGTTVTGYGIIRTTGNKAELVTMGIIELQKVKDHYTKLKMIFDRVLQLIDEYHPDELAIEAPFYGKNIQSMLKLGRAQGVAISAALSRSIPIFEYAPRKIKMAITGIGSASKEQVATLLQKILNFREDPRLLDATDGLAAAVCHFFQKTVPSREKEYHSWKEYIRKNPGRLLK
jgi:crossover junction endodeoxyribonuclease RuvC